MIQAIETEYAGYKFRSRLEARWAVFFNAMGVKWYYEHEGYKLSSGWYLPDFWLPEWKLHIEVKPDGICEHAQAFRDSHVGALVVTCGLPEEPMSIECWDIGDSSAGSSDWVCRWGDVDGLRLFVKCHTSREIYFEDPFEGNDVSASPFVVTGHTPPKPSLRLRDAFNLAKQARFDKRR